MSKYFKTEEEKDSSSLLLVDTNGGLENILINLICQKLADSVKIYALTSKKVPSNIDKLSTLSIHFLDKLSDSPSYAAIFLDDRSQKKQMFDMVKKLSGKKTKIVVVLSYRLVEDFIDFILACHEIHTVSIVLVGDLFGQHVLKSPMSIIIEKALHEKEIILSGNELIPIFPISEEDVISGLQHVLFSQHEKHRLYAFFYEHPQTLISLSHMIKRLEPELSISYGRSSRNIIEGKTEEETNVLLKQKIGSMPRYVSSSLLGFEKSARLLYDEKKDTYVPSRRRLHNTKHKGFSLNNYHKLFSYLSLSFLIFILFSFSVFVYSILEFRQGVIDLSGGKLRSAGQRFTLSKKSYKLVDHIVGTSFVIPSLFGWNKPTQYLAIYERLIEEVDSVIPTAFRFLEKNPKFTKYEIQSMTASFSNLFFLSNQAPHVQINLPVISQAKEDSTNLLPLLPVLPELLGYDSQKAYLLLLQNSNELRPTGGFIGSVALVSFKNGEAAIPVIQDVYDLDGQLSVHIEPSFIVRRYLQPHLYLRDSNFSPEFAESASSSALIYNLETGEKIDGVIAIDTKVLKTLLDIAGPFSIPGSSKLLNSQNATDILQNTIEDNFFPGSTQKRMVLNAILGHLVAEFQLQTDKKLQFLQKLPGLLVEKHILFSFAKPSLGKAFVASGFAGSLIDNRQAKNTLLDFLSLNEANTGVNKANEFITRKIAYSVLVKSSVIDSDVLISLSNSGSQDYSMYVRAIVPEDVSLLKVFINGTDQKITPAIINPLVYEKNGFKKLEGLEVSQTIVNGRKEIGFPVVVNKKSSLRVRLMYQHTIAQDLQDASFYSLLFIKQPGTDEYPLMVNVQSDGSYQVDDGAAVVFDNIVRTDKEIRVKLLRLK